MNFDDKMHTETRNKIRRQGLIGASKVYFPNLHTLEVDWELDMEIGNLKPS